MRINPYPPSFNKRPAKIIDPETGASTCALGNQICKRYSGSLVMNAKIIDKSNKKEVEENLKIFKNIIDRE